jgi:hypothetical protein
MKGTTSSHGPSHEFELGMTSIALGIPIGTASGSTSTTPTNRMPFRGGVSISLCSVLLSPIAARATWMRVVSADPVSDSWPAPGRLIALLARHGARARRFCRPRAWPPVGARTSPRCESEMSAHARHGIFVAHDLDAAKTYVRQHAPEAHGVRGPKIGWIIV